MIFKNLLFVMKSLCRQMHFEIVLINIGIAFKVMIGFLKILIIKDLHLIVLLEFPAGEFVVSKRVGGGLETSVAETLPSLPHDDGAGVVSGEEEVTLDIKADTVDVRTVTCQLLNIDH